MQRGVVIRRRRDGRGAALSQRLPAGMLIGGWGRLGDQSAQLTFTALFALLPGGHQPLHYLSHRAVDVAIGVATGLAVNLLAFPPLQVRPADHAIRHWGEEIAAALRDHATVATTPDSSGRLWPRHDRELTAAAGRPRRIGRRASSGPARGDMIRELAGDGTTSDRG
jgi:uncharacterized membrane protein YccC